MGIYRLDDGTRTAVTAVGSLNPKEWAICARRTSHLHRCKASGGIHWLTDGLPNLRQVSTDRNHSGFGWMGVVANPNYRVIQRQTNTVASRSPSPSPGLGALVWAWRRESS